MPIISQPQVGILGVGAVEKRAVVVDDAIAIRPVADPVASRFIDNDKSCGHHDHMPRPAVVGVRELKTRLGGYLRSVRQGRTLLITDRGQPVAELKPLARSGTEDAVLERLRAIGAVTRLESRPLAPFRPVRSGGPSLSDAIIEDRDERV